MTIRILSLTVVVVLTLYGCVTAPPNSSPPASDNQAALAPQILCTIPPVGAVSGTISVAQTVVAHFHGQTFSFDAQIQATKEEFDLVALDALGRRAMSVKWHDGRMESTRADWLPIQVRPADILADMAIVYWPVDVVSPALAACGAKLTTTASGRAVTAGGRNLITVTYERGEGWNRAAHLTNRAFGFDIDIQSAEIAQ
jgi:hypothetical protein